MVTELQRQMAELTANNTALRAEIEQLKRGGKRQAAPFSKGTREVDKGEKKTLYARLFRTPEYYLYDPFSQEFVGYRLRGLEYEEIHPDAAGKIDSPVTGLSLVVHEDWLRWMTPEGNILPTPWELAQQERQRAERAEELLETYRRRFGHLE